MYGAPSPDTLTLVPCVLFTSYHLHPHTLSLLFLVSLFTSYHLHPFFSLFLSIPSLLSLHFYLCLSPIPYIPLNMHPSLINPLSITHLVSLFHPLFLSHCSYFPNFPSPSPTLSLYLLIFILFSLFCHTLC